MPGDQPAFGASAVVRSFVIALAAFLAWIPAASSQDLPGLRSDLEFDALLKTVDMDEPSLKFIYESDAKEGSSIGFHIAECGHRRSASYVPYNSSSDPEAEVVSYRLARLLSISDLYNPVGYYALGPVATRRFRSMLQQNTESIPDRQENYARIVKQIAAQPRGLLGIYRFRPKGRKYAALSLRTQGQLNVAPLATFIRADGPMPTSNRLTLSGVRGQRPEYPVPSETEIGLARQLSIILVMDQLTGQWDRFWRNLEATGDRNGRLRLLARDNGGATLEDGWEAHGLYQKWVSRYDPDLINALKDLNAFLQKRNEKFGDFDSIEKWKAAAGILKDSNFETFRQKLERLIEKSGSGTRSPVRYKCLLPCPIARR